MSHLIAFQVVWITMLNNNIFSIFLAEEQNTWKIHRLRKFIGCLVSQVVHKIWRPPHAFLHGSAAAEPSAAATNVSSNEPYLSQQPNYLWSLIMADQARYGCHRDLRRSSWRFVLPVQERPHSALPEPTGLPLAMLMAFLPEIWL